MTSEPTVANETDDIYCQEPLGLVLPVYAVFSFDLFICEPQTNKPVLFSEPLEPVHQIKLNCLNLFVARAAQIYKLLTFRAPDSHSDSKWAQKPVHLLLWWMNHSVLQFLHQSEETVRLGPRLTSRRYVHEWTESLNERAKLKCLWFFIVYLKWWAVKTS